MGSRENFTDIEWHLLQMGLLWVFQGIAMADGKIEPVEINAIEHLSKNAFKLKNELAREVFSSIDFNREEFSNIYNLSPRINVGLQEVSSLLDEKLTPDKSVEFKKYLLAAGFYVFIFAGNSDTRILNDSRESKIFSDMAKLLRLMPVDLIKEPRLEDIIKELAE